MRHFVVEVTMYRLRMESCLLLGAGLLAGCSERNTPTAPSADVATLSPAGFIGDRPYMWTVKCSGGYGSSASWSWTAGGVTIAGTEASTYCTSTATGTGTRPAAADGFGHVAAEGRAEALEIDETRQQSLLIGGADAAPIDAHLQGQERGRVGPVLQDVASFLRLEIGVELALDPAVWRLVVGHGFSPCPRFD